MKKAFTLIELLVVIAIIAILAAILFPVFAQAKEAAKKTADLSNVKQSSTSFQMYLADTDDVWPLAIGQDAAGVWLWNFNHYIPADYPSAAGGDGSYARRIVASVSSWANSMQPYSKNYDILASPGTPAVSAGGASLATVAAGKRRANSTLTYNGILHGFGQSGIATPSKLPVLWNGRGKAQTIGAALANPVLYCNQANLPCTYIPAAANCSSGINGQQSAMFVLSGSMWVYSKGANFAMADGSAKFRRLGATLSPRDTDYNTDPYTGYDANGFPGFYWWDSCHSWLFRPNIEW